jgi:hypothetical protein
MVALRVVSPVKGAALKTSTERSNRLKIDDLDFEAFRLNPLSPEAIRCLCYMHDIESHTICYLRDLLVTRMHREAEVTAFVTCWAYEEHWHGDAIGQILAQHDVVSGLERIQMNRSALARYDSLRPIAYQFASAISGSASAVPIAWGAVNELVAQAAYGQLIAKDPHPVLSQLLRRIMQQEGRHIAFYLAQARKRLMSSRFAQLLTRWTLARYWDPVGSGIMPSSEVKFLCNYLFSGSDGKKVVGRLDRQVDSLPGLSGLALVQTAVQRYAY